MFSVFLFKMGLFSKPEWQHWHPFSARTVHKLLRWSNTFVHRQNATTIITTTTTTTTTITTTTTNSQPFCVQFAASKVVTVIMGDSLGVTIPLLVAWHRRPQKRARFVCRLHYCKTLNVSVAFISGISLDASKYGHKTTVVQCWVKYWKTGI